MQYEFLRNLLQELFMHSRCEVRWLAAMLAACVQWHIPAANAESPVVIPRERLAAALEHAGDNRHELERALTETRGDELRGMEFLIANMPESDLTSLSADFLLSNSRLAWQARREVPWGAEIPEEIFFNNVLPYANVDEKRDPWRQELLDLCLPLVKECRTPAEAAQKLNVEVFPKLNLKYSTQRSIPNQSPRQAISEGKASCTGLSIVLSDACRSVCVPARLVGTPLWANKRGNHTWVEIWDADWHFTGACEPDKAGLDRGWFIGDAAKAQKDSFEHAIYAASFARTDRHYPLVWAMKNRSVPAENVTDRYTRSTETGPAKNRLLVRVLNADGKRVERPVTVTDAADAKREFRGKSRGETADTNDIAGFDLTPGGEYQVEVDRTTTSVTLPADGKEHVVEIRLP